MLPLNDIVCLCQCLCLCQYCRNHVSRPDFNCATCASAYYCSGECRDSDAPQHQRNPVHAWQPCRPSFVPNPWYAATTIRSEPAPELVRVADTELLAAAEAGDCAKLRACIIRGALLSVVRGPYGAGALHLAVVSGSTDAVALLLDAGAYINISDWRMATPLYYACTALDERDDMIKLLVARGADTMQMSTFSGQRPWQKLDSTKQRALVLESPFHKKFVVLRDTINATTASIEARQLVDLIWRSRTADWSIQPGRSHANQNFNPMPGLIAVEQPEAVEAVFKDCQRRHVQWLEGLL